MIKRLLLAGLLLATQAAYAITPGKLVRIGARNPLSSVAAARAYSRSTQPTMFLDPDYVGSDRENLATYSADTSNADWTKTGATVSTVTITASAGASAHTAAQLKTGVTPLGTNYRVSFKAKAGTFSVLCSYEADGSLFNGVTVNLATGAIAQTANLVSSSISAADSNGYYSVEYVYTVEGASSNTRITVGIPSNTSQTTCNSWSAAGTETILVKELQLQRASQNAVYTETTATPIYGPSPGITSVNVVSSINTLYGSTAAFTQSTDANKPILSRPDRVENIVTQSADLSSADWSKTSCTASTVTLTASAGASGHSAVQTISGGIAQIGMGMRARLKAKAGTYSVLCAYEGNGSLFNGVTVNLATGAIAQAVNVTSSSISAADADGYYTIEYAWAVEGSAFTGLRVGFPSSTSAVSCDSWTAAGTETVLVKELQLQRSSMQPSYIATTTAPVYGSLTGRRMLTFDGTNDSLSSTSALSAVLSASGGTAFSLSVPMFEDANTSCAGAFYSDTSSIFADSGPYFGHAIQSVGPRAYLYNGSVYSCVSLTYALKQPVILTSWYDGANQYAYYNNQAVTQGAGGTAPSSLTGTLYVGSRAAGAYFNGQLGPIITYNRVLPQPERDMVQQILQKFWRVG